MKRLWLDALGVAVGFVAGWLAADAYVRAQLEGDAPGDAWEFR